ncbi:GGDEF domain-containing protein [Marinicella litoralis]|uniref:diguanylate cyclase n=1 Tax=Marinicella litoralis TaxID=644220 RepID=A0A4R6XIM6_9GAMM|nr:GGDEF domain-containing protein [Marinicella litoralis]TDR19335.1 diguanylate cyclase (GGDEF)-like protein [Marinicella litoralis]
MLFLCVCTSFAQISVKSSGEPQYITDELLRLESLRINNPQLFGDGLDALAFEQMKMSSYQQCHYAFLRAYQKAFKGESKQAIKVMENLIPSCDDLRVRVRLNALIANISVIGGNYLKASNHIDLVIQNAEQTADTTTKTLAYSAAAIVYNLLDQRELGVKYSELLYNLEPTDKNLCHLHYSSNVHHLDGNNPPKEFSEIKEMSGQCKSSGNLLYSQFLILDNIKWKLAQDRLDENALGEIEAEIRNIDAEIQNSPYKNILGIFAAIKAKFYWFKSENKLAQSHALNALKLNQDLGNTEQLIMALEVLEKVSKDNGDFQSSYNYLKKINKTQLSMYDETQAKQMAFMAVKHSNLAKVFEIEQLNRQKEVLELEKKLANQEANNQRLIILLILTVLAMMVLWLFKIKKRHDYFRDVSEIDHLTKVLTRKAFEEQVKVQLENCEKTNSPINIAIMDLDLFKNVNDSHGHLIGDWVLKNVVYAIKELVEENMILARLGGEEFCIVMADVDCETMRNKLEMMRSAIETLDCSESGAKLSVTASFGYTSSVTSGYSLPLLLTHADVALFDAKKHGRNQVVKFKTLQGRT